MSEGSIVQYNGDRVLYRSSMLGTPDWLKVLTAARIGYQEVRTRDEKVLGAFQAGHLLEDRVLDLARSEGWFVWDQQAEVVLLLTGRIGVIGHIDAKGRLRDRDYLVEVKTQSEGEWKNFEKHGWESGFFPRYTWQVSSYMLATRLPLAMIRAQRTKDGTDVEKIAVEYVDKPFWSEAEIRRRLLSVEVQAAKQELPEKCEEKCYPCPFPYLCTEVDRERIDDEWIEAAAQTFKQAETDRKSANQRYDDAKSALVAALGTSKKAVLGSGVKVSTWTQGAGARRLSDDSRRALIFLLWWFYGVDLSSLEQQGTAQRVSVTLPKEYGG